MRLATRFMCDTLTVDVLVAGSGGTVDPIDGTTTTARTLTRVVEQPCSDQDLSLRQRSNAIIAGQPGALGVSKCYTKWFPWPDAGAGEIVVRVNGKYRPLKKAGPPVDVGGQAGVYELELGPPEEGR